jgi:hypothetical protein
MAKPKKSGFVYRKRDPDIVKRFATRRGGGFDSIFKPSIDVWRPKEGDNDIRILPPTWDNAEHYGYQIWVHYGIGPNEGTYLCPARMVNKRCPICDAMREARANSDEEEEKQLKPSERFVVYVVDRNADKKEAMRARAFSMSWTMDRDINALRVMKKTGEVLDIDDPNEGFDISFGRTGTTPTNTKYIGTQISREATPISDDDEEQEEVLEYITQNPIPDTFNFYSADYLEKLLTGKVEDKDEDLDQEEARDREAEEENEGREARRSLRTKRDVEEEEEEERPMRRKAKAEEEEDDEPWDDDDEANDEAEEEEERPTRRAASNGRKPRVRDDDDEEEERPLRRAKREERPTRRIERRR